jgi:hypothetical protein
LRTIRSRNGILEAGPFVFFGIWARQGANAFTVNAWIWGALDEPIPANNNDLIERAVA